MFPFILCSPHIAAGLNLFRFDADLIPHEGTLFDNCDYVTFGDGVTIYGCILCKEYILRPSSDGLKVSKSCQGFITNMTSVLISTGLLTSRTTLDNMNDCCCSNSYGLLCILLKAFGIMNDNVWTKSIHGDRVFTFGN
jgi:hypothetical protein